METTMTKEMAMSAVREICTRPWRGANRAHAGTASAPFRGALCPSPVMTTVATSWS